MISERSWHNFLFGFVAQNYNFLFTICFPNLPRYVWGFLRPEQYFLNSKMRRDFRSTADMLHAAGPCQEALWLPLSFQLVWWPLRERWPSQGQQHCYCCSSPGPSFRTAHRQAPRRDFPAPEPKTGTLTPASWYQNIEENGFLLSSFPFDSLPTSQSLPSPLILLFSNSTNLESL